MAVCLAGSALASVSWYIMKDTGNEGIKYFKDEQGGYSPGNWANAQTSGTLSGLLNGDDILDSDTVYISQGTYALDALITISKALTVYGGFSGSGSEQTLDDRKDSNAPVILSGQDTHQILAISANATFDSLTFTHGKSTSDGGAVSITKGAPIFTNCAITDNTAKDNGGGIAIKGGVLTLTNCSIVNNKAPNGGGFYAAGIASSPVSVTLTNCTIAGNKATTNGAGIYIQTSTLAILNCNVVNNKGANSGGIELYSFKGTASLTNSFAWNTDSSNAVKTAGSGVTQTYTSCVLPPAITEGTDTISLDQWTNPLSSSSTVSGVTHTVFTLADNPDLLVLMSQDKTAEAPSTDILGHPRFTPPTIGSLEYPFDTGYDVSTPDGLTVYGIGWNTQGTITAKNKPSVAGKLFHPLKKVKVTASSTNGWMLKSEFGDTIKYVLKSEKSGPETTTWEFSADELNAEGGTSKVVGADVEDFSMNRPGAYDDTVTYTVTLEDK